MDATDSGSRRACLSKLAGMIVAIPLAALATNVGAAKNDAMRQSLMYRDSPKDGKQCSACAHWVAAKSPSERGGCEVLATDTEISPTGWCVAFVEAKK